MSYLPGSPGCAESSRALQKNTVHLIISSHLITWEPGTGGRAGASGASWPQLSHLQIVIFAS